MSSQLGSLKTSPHFNVIKDERGSIIPPTQRPDGTWRKAIRVKEGYVPQEEVPLYESKGKQWANRNAQYPIGYSPVTSNQDSSKPFIPGLVILDTSKKTKSKKKSSTNAENSINEVNKEQAKEKSKPQKSAESGSSEKKDSSNNSKKNSKSKKDKGAPAEKQLEPEIDPKKKLRNMKKKLREIEAIEEKIRTGGSKSVDADQRKKVSTKADLLVDILTLQQLCLDD